VSGADPTPVSINPISSLITDMDTGDFDSDGNVDVVLASAGSQVIVLLGDGSFGFSAGAPVAVANGVMRVRSLDFDLDGRLDLATQSNLSDSITLLRGDGAGGLTVHSSFVAGSSTTVPEVGDLDGDGRVDLALIASGAIATWRGTSNGFQPMWSTPSNSARWLRLADIDADGVLDIAAVPINVTSALRLYFGAGDGSFGPPEFYADACANPSVCATDTDGDGRVDIVLAGYTNHRYSIAPALMILRRRGDLPASYCGEAPNPAGCRGSLTVHGCPTLGQSSGFAVNVGGVGNHRAALLVYGYERAVAPFHGERLCIAEPRHRTGIIDTGGNTGTDDCSGSFAFDFASYASTGADPALVSGAVVCCQAVVRDPGAPGHVGVTNALEFTLLP
jgi:hypothetical protein